MQSCSISVRVLALLVLMHFQPRQLLVRVRTLFELFASRRRKRTLFNDYDMDVEGAKH